MVKHCIVRHKGEKGEKFKNVLRFLFKEKKTTHTFLRKRICFLNTNENPNELISIAFFSKRVLAFGRESVYKVLFYALKLYTRYSRVLHMVCRHAYFSRVLIHAWFPFVSVEG